MYDVFNEIIEEKFLDLGKESHPYTGGILSSK
jgi:hypothetical protein